MTREELIKQIDEELLEWSKCKYPVKSTIALLKACKQRIKQDSEMAELIADMDTQIKELAEVIKTTRNDIFYFMTRHSIEKGEMSYQLLGEIKEDLTQALSNLGDK